ncbi:hypothetical protein M089_2177 [Bacteroides ovatus str. 3725 D9 iii]|nr:hypothetical protein M088_4068 [Bacteroides ovatus str. 3725 D1 iv]KDS15963.1 hypothetical protein M082_4827 [Bacteroides fragilis str. 3725 D9 ii]KDS42352.1 hypothetical protein M089_2177 [Bacteroides ovatus str. 3725 D9 iii]
MNHWEQLCGKYKQTANVVICFQISIFEPLGTIAPEKEGQAGLL